MNAYDEGYAAHAQEVAPRIAALEAEVERLRCCGNCEHLCENNATLWPCSEGGWTKPIDPCRFTPSRWTEREA